MTLDNLLGNIGRKIQSRRKDLKMTQEKLAEASHISREFLSKIENGKTENISLKILFNISKSLGLEPMDLFKK